MLEGQRLNLLAKLSQATILPDVLRIAEGDRLTAPLVVDLDPTTFCDLACPECISASLLNQQRFSRDRLITLAGEMASSGVRAVVLIGGGEPMAHPATPELIQTLAASELRLGLVTNGTLIGRHAQLLGNTMDWVRVSVDAGTSETYATVRPSKSGKNRFNDVIANIEKVAAVGGCAVGYSFLIIVRPDATGALRPINHHEISTAANLAKDLGCTYFEVKAMFDEGHNVLQLSEIDKTEIMQELKLCLHLESDTFKIEASSTIAALEAPQQGQPKEYLHCPITELRTVVTPSGVYSCSYHRGDPLHRRGSVVEDSFEDMWSRSVSQTNPSKDCTFHCARHQENLAILAWGSHNAVPPTPVPDYDPFF